MRNKVDTDTKSLKNLFSGKRKKHRNKAVEYQMTRPYKNDFRKTKSNLSKFPKPEDEDIISLYKRKKKKKYVIQSSEQRFNSRTLGIVLLTCIGLVIILLIFLILLFGTRQIKNLQKQLQTNENIKRAFLSNNKIYVELVETDLSKINNVRFIFLGDKEYYLTMEKGQKYEFTPSMLGLSSFRKIEKVSAVFQ